LRGIFAHGPIHGGKQGKKCQKYPENHCLSRNEDPIEPMASSVLEGKSNRVDTATKEITVQAH
jgi:hypothetical protein